MASRELRIARFCPLPSTACSRASAASALAWVVARGVLLLVAAGAAAAVVFTRQPGDVSIPDVEFTQDAAAPPTVPPTSPEGGAHPFDDDFSWPMYGYTKHGRRYLPLNADLRPPFVQAGR